MHNIVTIETKNVEAQQIKSIKWYKLKITNDLFQTAFLNKNLYIFIACSYVLFYLIFIEIINIIPKLNSFE